MRVLIGEGWDFKVQKRKLNLPCPAPCPSATCKVPPPGMFVLEYRSDNRKISILI